MAVQTHKFLVMEEKVKIAERSNIERTEKTGECYTSEDGKHFYLIRDEDILHLNDKCINTLYDNALSNFRENYKWKFKLISRTEFYAALNKTVFELDFLSILGKK